jgi:hypothetical protein
MIAHCVARPNSRSLVSPEWNSSLAHDRCQSGELAGSIEQRNDRELEGDPGAVLSDPGNREEVAMTVTAFASLDDVMIAVPMTLSQPFRDDDV